MDENQVTAPISTDNPITQKPNNKKRLIIIIGIIVLLTVIIPIVVYSIISSRVQIVSGEKGDIRFDIDSEAPMALNIYKNMYENITLSDLDTLIEKSGYALRKDKDSVDEDIIYLTTATSTRREGVCLYGDGYIKYRVDHQEGLTEEQEPNKWAVDIEYHECVRGNDTYIIEMLDGKYRNFTGSVTIDYETKDEAILNQLSVREK